LNPLYFFHKMIHTAEGDNDGLVSIRSANWGEYLGTIEGDHMEIINWSPFFDASNIYLQVAKFLVDHEIEIERCHLKIQEGTSNQQPQILKLSPAGELH